MLPRFLTQPTQQVNWASPLNQGLVSWWLALPGRVGGGTWFDLCGRNHGTLANMDPATDWVENSLDFDGTDDVVNLTLTNDLQPTRQVTVAAMIKAASGIGNFDLVFRAGQINGSNGYGIYYDTSAIKFFAGSYLSFASKSFSGDNLWHFVVGTYNGDASSNQINVYVDGAVGTPATYTTSLTYTGATATISHASSGFSTWTGRVRSVRVWKRALSASEALALTQDNWQDHPQTLNRIRRPLAFDTGAGGGGGGNAGHRIIGGGWGGRVICAA